MLQIKNITLWNGQKTDLYFENGKDQIIESSHLLAMPAVIDPHVHFRTPGMEYKENWLTGAQAAIRGGCTTVFDMPNTIPPTITHTRLAEKKAIIDAQLQEANIPLRYQLFFGADKNHLAEITAVKTQCIGIKVFMGCSTGNLVIDDDESLAKVFAIAANHNMLVAVHAEDEHAINHRRQLFKGDLNYRDHSKIRNIEVATIAVSKAISLSQQYNTRLYILHVSSQDEIALIKAAKLKGIPVFAETTPHHLFLSDLAYADLGGKAVVNPPLRSQDQQETLFAAIADNVIDTIGSDHAPHTLAEKSAPYGKCPSGMPGIEFMLPLLLNAYHQNKLTLDDIVGLTSKHAQKIFNLEDTHDWVLIDLERTAKVQETLSKCGWTSYQGMTLKGWPAYTILRGMCFPVFLV